MNESTPPPAPDPDKLPPELESALYYKQNKSSTPLSKKACAGIGFLLFVISGVLSIGFIGFCLLGLAAAIASLFFKGYRFIFVGYALTLGILLLSATIYCAYNPLRID